MEEEDKMTEMPLTGHFVLVHGLSFGAWCWYKIRCLLESSGYKVTCVDLKSAGSDITDPDTVLTLEDFHQPLYQLFSTLPQNEKVILVGHSAGGITVTDAMYKYSDKVQGVIYVAAPMLKHGFSTPEDIEVGTPDLSEYGNVCDYGYGFGPDKPPTSVMLKKEFQREILFNTTPIEDSVLASMVIRRGPSRPLQGAIFKGDDEEADQITRIYVKTLNDRNLKVEKQESMIKRWPPSRVYTLETDHSPFFSAPLLLSGFLVNVANSLRN